jgi:hypothetical protein
LSHEPDLLACAEALGVAPKALVEAHAALAAPMGDADWGHNGAPAGHHRLRRSDPAHGRPFRDWLAQTQDVTSP